MGTLSSTLGFCAAALGLIGLLWGIAVAFQRSVGWGVIALLLAPAGVIAFLVMTCRENYKPLALIVGARVLALAAVLVAQASGGAL